MRAFREVFGEEGAADDELMAVVLATREEASWDWELRSSGFEPQLSNWIYNRDWEASAEYEGLQKRRYQTDEDDAECEPCSCDYCTGDGAEDEDYVRDDDAQTVLEAEDSSWDDGESEPDAWDEPAEDAPEWRVLSDDALDKARSEPIPWDADDGWIPPLAPIEAAFAGAA